MIEKRLEVWPIDKIVPYENNPRKNDQAVPDVVESMGLRQSISWLRENIDKNAEEVWGLPKYKYIFVFDKKQRREWQKKALPYPKKPCQQTIVL